MNKPNIYALIALIVNYLFSLYDRIIKVCDVYIFFLFASLIFILGIIALFQSNTLEKNTKRFKTKNLIRLNETSQLKQKDEKEMGLLEKGKLIEQEISMRSKVVLHLKNSSNAQCQNLFKKIREKTIKLSIFSIKIIKCFSFFI